MSAKSKISELPEFVLIVLTVLGIYLIYKLVMFLSVFFVYLGFNIFLFLDNLLEFESVNPIVLWCFFGLLLGSIVGVLIAIKKYKLTKILILYPVALFVFIITLLIFINKPTNALGEYSPSNFGESNTNQIKVSKVTYHVTTQTVNVRYRPMASSSKLMTLSAGIIVEFIENTIDNRNKTWSKIRYTNPQTGNTINGYINTSYLRYYNQQ